MQYAVLYEKCDRRSFRSLYIVIARERDIYIVNDFIILLTDVRIT